MSIAAKARESTASAMREHKFLGGDQEKLFDEEFRRDRTTPAREKRRVYMRDKRRETTRDCGGHE